MDKWTQEDLISQNPAQWENSWQDFNEETRYQQQDIDTPVQIFSSQDQPAEVYDVPQKPAGKKRLVFLSVAAFLLLSVVLYFNIHIWADATCEAPRTCRLCGKTTGAPLDHQWENGFCVYCADPSDETLRVPETEPTVPVPETTIPETTVPATTVPETTAPAPQVTDVTLKIWTPQEDQLDAHSWLLQMQDVFQQTHPEYRITWENTVCDESEVVQILSESPDADVDVFLYPSDRMNGLLESGSLTRLDGVCLDQVMADVSTSYVNTVTGPDGGVYGFPISCSTWFMYYNKSMLSEEDVTSFEACLDKGKVAFPVINPWYLPSFFVAAGGSLFGETGADADAGVLFGGDVGINATSTLLHLLAHPNFVIDDEGFGQSEMIHGRVAACFSGSWDYYRLREALGDRLGVAVLPSVEMEGGPAQLKPFACSKAVGVHPNGENQDAAMQFAAFLASPYSQLLRFQLLGITPAATILADHPDIAADAVASVEMDTMLHTSIGQPSIPEMNYIWELMIKYGFDLADGFITRETMYEFVQMLQEDLNGLAGIS